MAPERQVAPYPERPLMRRDLGQKKPPHNTGLNTRNCTVLPYEVGPSRYSSCVSNAGALSETRCADA
jgi:hypothetical protein